MIFCARATRGRRLPSFDARNRGSTRLPFKSKWESEEMRAREDQSAPILEGTSVGEWRQWQDKVGLNLNLMLTGGIR